jgi:hypothetical protein
MEHLLSILHLPQDQLVGGVAGEGNNLSSKFWHFQAASMQYESSPLSSYVFHRHRLLKIKDFSMEAHFPFSKSFLIFLLHCPESLFRSSCAHEFAVGDAKASLAMKRPLRGLRASG